MNPTTEKDKYDVVLENLGKDLSLKNKKCLLTTLRQVDDLDVQPIRDNYSIRVHLKDTFLFRYAPRRMSMSEKKELETITDDLLSRKIIKPSISPYCARVILVAKRNGTKRMCVDLRPLNPRIYQQILSF